MNRSATLEADVMLCALVAVIDPDAYVVRRDGTIIQPGTLTDWTFADAPGLDKDTIPENAPTFQVTRNDGAGWWGVVVGPLAQTEQGGRYLGGVSYPFGEAHVRTAAQLAHTLYVARLAVATSRDRFYRR